jgi:ubiquinone/menaquinone biosynthesis C-methylase UbiE
VTRPLAGFVPSRILSARLGSSGAGEEILFLAEVQKLYDQHVARHFDEDPRQLYAASHQVAFDQIRKHAAGMGVRNALDLAVGTGNGLLKVRELFPGAALSGIDVSSKMIEISKQKLDVETFHDSATNIDRYVAAESRDLVLLHFLLAYVDPATIVRQAFRLLRRGGLCSIATSTFESFRRLQDAAAPYFSKEQLRALAGVPEDRSVLRDILAAEGFETLEDGIFRKELTFPDFDDLYDFGLRSAWLTQYFAPIKGLKKWVIKLGSRKLFPFSDEFHANILLLRKP